MTGLDALVLRGWLTPIAPTLTAHPQAPLAALAAAATGVLTPNYGGRERLAGALANALRRAAGTGLLNTESPGLDPSAAAAAVTKQNAAFRALVDRELPQDLEAALVALLAGLPGLSAHAAAAAPEILEALDYQVIEVLPQEGPYGLKPAVVLLEDYASRAASAELRRLAHRDLGSALSLLGEPALAREHFLKSGDRIRARLEAAEEALAQGDPAGAIARTDEAVAMARRVGDGRYEGVALRRKAMLVGAGGDVAAAEALLIASVGVFRAAEDGRGEAEAVEALAHSAADRGAVDRAVTLLGAVRRLQRGRGFAAGEGRALRLAGRLLCEHGHPVAGMVMLFQARAIAEAADPHVEHPLEHYMSGFQETLSPDELSAIERALDSDWDPQIAVAFAAARCRAPDAMDGL